MTAVLAPRPTIDVLLEPGDYFVGDHNHQVRTLLGSCVSITLWSPGPRIGAMCHFLLARRGRAGDGPLDSRYGDEALDLMCAGLRARGVDPASCEAKLFGGGDMFGRPQMRSSIGVGHDNGIQARRMVEARGARVVAESLFGEGHRQIVFDVASGSVWVHHAPLRPLG